MESQKHLLQDSRAGYHDGNRNKKKFILLTVMLAGLIYGNSLFVYASEFGGFDISTGTGEYEGDWSDWDDEPAYNAPEQDNSDSYTNEVRNDGQETAQNNTGSSVYTDDYAYNVTQNENGQGNSTTYEPDTSSASGYSEDYTAWNQNESENTNNNRSSTVTGKGMNGGINSSAVTEISPTPIPTETPTPVPTPTIKPTFTPTPVFTEVPKEKVDTVTEYKEEYRLPPAECLQKMKLFYWRGELPEGKNVEVQLDFRVMPKVVSVRINRQEKPWKQNGQTVQVNGLSDEKNKLEIAVMIPKDLTWTGDKKNVILTYNVF